MVIKVIFHAEMYEVYDEDNELFYSTPIYTELYDWAEEMGYKIESIIGMNED